MLKYTIEVMLYVCKKDLRSYMLRTSIIPLFLLLSVSVISAQNRKFETPPLKERLFYGGSMGLQFGSITDIQISPIVGIWVLPRLAIAAGPNYRYYKNHFMSTDIYGGRTYMQLVVIQDISTFIPFGKGIGIFLHCENELLSLKSSSWKNPPYSSSRFYLNTLLAGAGLSQQMGRRSSLNIMVLWALNDSYYDIYGNPEIRFAFIF
jgi:hypothetical protein